MNRSQIEARFGQRQQVFPLLTHSRTYGQTAISNNALLVLLGLCRQRKVGTKTVTETFSSPAALSKAQREVAEFHRFREMGSQLLDVNERICALRPVEEPPLSAQEKKRPKLSTKKSRAK
jgi:hypothetical protein